MVLRLSLRCVRWCWTVVLRRQMIGVLWVGRCAWGLQLGVLAMGCQLNGYNGVYIDCLRRVLLQYWVLGHEALLTTPLPAGLAGLRISDLDLRTLIWRSVVRGSDLRQLPWQLHCHAMRLIKVVRRFRG